MTETTATQSIIAYTAEDDHLAPVREAAERLARERGGALILYDIDAAKPLEGSPLPTAWSGEGEREQVPIRLAPGDLERAGRHAIAEQVRGARDRGIDAWGWLPADPGGGSLAGYARRVGAGVVLVPDDLESPDLLERLTGGSATGVSDELQPQIELRVVPT